MSCRKQGKRTCRLFTHMQADVDVQNNSFAFFPFVNSSGCKWKSWQIFNLIEILVRIKAHRPQNCKF